MERFLVLFSMILSINAFSATPSGVPQLGLGGSNANPPSLVIEESNPKGYFSLIAIGFSGTSALIPFTKNGFGAYQVTSGKTAHCVTMQYMMNQAATAGGSYGVGSFTIFTATATFATGDSTATGQVFMGGSSSARLGTALTAITWYPVQIDIDFAATLWPGVQLGTNNPGTVILSCKEI